MTSAKRKSRHDRGIRTYVTCDQHPELGEMLITDAAITCHVTVHTIRAHLCGHQRGVGERALTFQRVKKYSNRFYDWGKLGKLPVEETRAPQVVETDEGGPMPLNPKVPIRR